MRIDMYFYPSSFYFLLFTFYFLLYYSPFCKAQKTRQIELLHANSLEYDDSHGTRAKRLIGNVAFKHEGSFMNCDSAYWYSDDNKLTAYSRVNIRNEENTTITGDTLYYEGNTKNSQIHGKVQLFDKDIQLTTNYLEYRMKDGLAYYNSGGYIINNKDHSTLISRIGNYYPKRKEFFFRDSVVVKHPDYTIYSDSLMYNTETDQTHFIGPTIINNKDNSILCERGLHDAKTAVSRFWNKPTMTADKQTLTGDSIIYNREKGTGLVIGNVVVDDTVQDIVITGDTLLHFEKDSISIITGHAMLMQFYAKDTLFLHADTLYTTYDSTRKHRIMSAYFNAKFYKPDMQGMCDSLVLDDGDSTIKLFEMPLIWSDENQMSADFIKLITYGGEIRTMHFVQNAFIASQEDSVRYNQIKGKNMTGYFEKSKLYKLDVLNSGQTIYYAREDNGDYIGMNRADGDTIAIYVKNSKVNSITFPTQTKATLYPLDKIPENEALLKGFKWHNNVRPNNKDDIFVAVEKTDKEKSSKAGAKRKQKK